MADTPDTPPDNPYSGSPDSPLDKLPDKSPLDRVGPTDPSELLIDEMRATWIVTLVLSVFGFLFSGLLAFGAVVALLGIEPSRSRPQDEPNPIVMVFMLGGFLLVSFLVFRYSQAAGKFSRSGDGVDLEDALAAQRTFWRFVGGSLALVFILGCLISLLGFVVGFVMSAALA
ncbi:MAG: hypothetical protein N2C14_14670 [Planctomycetales bacterium]